MNTKVTITFLGLLITCVSCSLFDNEQASVSAVIENEELIIRNGLPTDMYYFAAPQSVLAVILWAPLVEEENRIRAGESKSFRLTDIYPDFEEDPIVVYYWDKDITEIFEIVIE